MVNTSVALADAIATGGPPFPERIVVTGIGVLLLSYLAVAAFVDFRNTMKAKRNAVDERTAA